MQAARVWIINAREDARISLQIARKAHNIKDWPEQQKRIADALESLARMRQYVKIIEAELAK